MTYVLGQAFGILSTICCLILPLFRKKWQMLVTNALINSLMLLNLHFIGRLGPVGIIYVIAVIQVGVALLHLNRGTPITKRENVIFLILYVAGGLVSYRSPIDLLPIVGSVFNMLATFQIDVQKTRGMLLINAAAFLVYYILLQSTSALATTCTLVTTLVAMCRHKQQHST